MGTGAPSISSGKVILALIEPTLSGELCGDREQTRRFSTCARLRHGLGLDDEAALASDVSTMAVLGVVEQLHTVVARLGNGPVLNIR